MSEVSRSSWMVERRSNAAMIGRLLAIGLALALDVAIGIGAWWALSSF
ncbi:MAG: hypothetical protein ACLQJR_10305 [Stellaceae bacterium]